MNIGDQILNIRKENQLTQEAFDKLFHVTRQTVSNWENGKIIFTRFISKNYGHYCWNYNGMYWLV